MSRSPESTRPTRPGTAPDRPLRLLALTHSLGGGGAERFLATLVNHLDREAFAPEVCAAIGRASYPLASDVALTSLDYRGPLTLPRTVRRLRRRIRDRRPDLVLSNVLSTNALAGAALRGVEPRPPWVARIGNAPGVREPRLQRWWARRCYAMAAAVVANSSGGRAAFARCYPETAGRLRHLPSPTDFARLDGLAAAPAARRRGADPQLVWMGRLTRQKRPDLMIAALAELVRRRPARLWMCGEGPLRRQVESEIAAAGLGETVELLGFVENPFALMRQADLFVMTSDYEGLPNALIEAQGLGLAAVSTRCPHGPDEIIAEGETGLLVPTGDARALAAALDRLLAAPEERRRMAERARASARSRYSVEVVLPAWERLLLESAGREI
jgi:glycosyltransferase involved in cell wall biosynthesis